MGGDTGAGRAARGAVPDEPIERALQMLDGRLPQATMLLTNEDDEPGWLVEDIRAAFARRRGVSILRGDLHDDPARIVRAIFARLDDGAALRPNVPLAVLLKGLDVVEPELLVALLGRLASLQQQVADDDPAAPTLPPRVVVIASAELGAFRALWSQLRSSSDPGARAVRQMLATERGFVLRVVSDGLVAPTRAQISVAGRPATSTVPRAPVPPSLAPPVEGPSTAEHPARPPHPGNRPQVSVRGPAAVPMPRRQVPPMSSAAPAPLPPPPASNSVPDYDEDGAADPGRPPLISRRTVLAGLGVGVLVIGGAGIILPRLGGRAAQLTRGLIPHAAPTCAAVKQTGYPTGAPSVIPNLQAWTPGKGGFVLQSSSRIVVDRAYADQLGAAPSLLAADLAAATGRPALSIVTDDQPNPCGGDIFLTLGATEPRLNDEGYTMTVADNLTIAGKAPAGLMHGTQTVLQLLHQNPAIQGGVAQDWPAFPERALMVDIGRKYFSVPWLKAHIREMAFLKMSYLHLHLSDDQGFRLESHTHPEFVAADRRLSRAEMADIVSYAAQYGIIITPEIDMPSHMTAMLSPSQNAGLQLVDSGGTAYASLINLSKPEAYTFMQSVLDEYWDLFPGPFWHMGADEYVIHYNAFPGLDPNALYQYITWAHDQIRKHGKTPRAWNDGIVPPGSTAATMGVPTDMVIEWWSDNGLSPQHHLDRGRQVMNTCEHPTYHTLGRYDINAGAIYDVAWEPWTFADGLTVDQHARGLLGAKMHIWCDHPNAQDEATVAQKISLALRAMAQKDWNSPLPDPDVNGFQVRATAIGHSPGWPSGLS